MPNMMSPDGILGQVPDEKVEEAQAAGFKIMSNDHLQKMHNRLFLAQKFFDEKHPKLKNWRLPRGRGQW